MLQKPLAQLQGHMAVLPTHLALLCAAQGCLLVETYASTYWLSRGGQAG